MKQCLGEKKNEARMNEGKRDKTRKREYRRREVEPDSGQTLQPRRHLGIVSPI
jgi:hypothetical protein